MRINFQFVFLLCPVVKDLNQNFVCVCVCVCVCPSLAQYFSPNHLSFPRPYCSNVRTENITSAKLCRNQCQRSQAFKHKDCKTPVYFCPWIWKSFFLWHVFLFCQVNLCEMGKPNAATLNYVYDLPENLHHSLVNKFPHRIQRTSGAISLTAKWFDSLFLSKV
jgi:hypothetical protein